MAPSPHSTPEQIEVVRKYLWPQSGPVPREARDAFDILVEELEACLEESATLAINETASSMAAQGRRVWEPAQSEAAKRIVQLENAIRHELGMTHGDDTIRRLRAALESND